MNTVHIVSVVHAEGRAIKHVCVTEAMALQRWNEVRLELVKQAEEWMGWSSDDGKTMYAEQITALSNPDPKTIDNSPYETPVIEEYPLDNVTEVVVYHCSPEEEAKLMEFLKHDPHGTIRTPSEIERLAWNPRGDEA
jgi:hypothetical protein